MRYSYLFAFFALSAHAQINVGTGSINCTEADMVNGGDLQCATLTITTSPAFSLTAAALNIQVKGDVLINDDLSLAGGDGLDEVSAGDLKATPGPGGSGGGSYAFGSPTPGEGSSGGGAGDQGTSCGGGGAGGGFAQASQPGTTCLDGVGGSPGPAFLDILSNTLRGGFGGGAGDTGDITVTVGTGGSGGGAIRIRAGGNIIINANLSANGGRGGNTVTNGGGGGGGSGGVIWLQTLGTITNNGIISADGGLGGTSGNLGSGSSGSRGVVRLETANGAIINPGTLPPYGEVMRISNHSLNSSISCGTTGEDEDQNSLLQLVVGLALAVSFGSAMKKVLKVFTQAKA